MTIKEYLEPVRILFHFIETSTPEQDITQHADFQRLLPHIRRIKNAGEKDQFIQFVHDLLYADTVL